MDRIHAVKSLDGIFLEFQGDILGLTDADRVTLYAVDHERKELYSKYLAGDVGHAQEIRVPISDQSIAGWVANSRRSVNITDAYDKSELARLAPGLASTAAGTRRRATAPSRSWRCRWSTRIESSGSSSC